MSHIGFLAKTVRTAGALAAADLPSDGRDSLDFALTDAVKHHAQNPPEPPFLIHSFRLGISMGYDMFSPFVPSERLIMANHRHFSSTALKLAGFDLKATGSNEPPRPPLVFETGV